MTSETCPNRLFFPKMTFFEGNLFFDNFSIFFQKSCSSRLFQVKIWKFDDFDLNFVRKATKRLQGEAICYKNDLDGLTTTKPNAILHCFVKGTAVQNSFLLADGIFQIPSAYLTQTEFVLPENFAKNVAKIDPNLPVLLKENPLIAEIVAKTLVQKIGNDLYFVIYAKLFSKDVDLVVKIVCLGENHLYIYLLYQSMVLGKNYLFTNLKSSKFRVENSSNYYAALMISSSTKIHLLTIPLLRQLKPLMHLYNPNIDKKYSSSPVNCLHALKGKITKATKYYYELDNTTR
jgi:hypothetical protein